MSLTPEKTEMRRDEGTHPRIFGEKVDESEFEKIK